jgi:REP element-mobilizing transposase RayT
MAGRWLRGQAHRAGLREQARIGCRQRQAHIADFTANFVLGPIGDPDYCRLMTRARKHLVCLDETPYYHVTSRCVRRAFLCGVDRQTGKSYEHRRPWIEDRIRVLSALFSIELCAYAIMNNHYHLVVRINSDEPDGWSDDEVLNRWTALFHGPILVQRYLAGDPLTAAEFDTVRAVATLYRARLGSLSWFMKCLNEPIAKKANAEDGCRGHFWEARFHSQPLRSEAALLAAMAYVDLNPVRAGIASTPEDSDYTSIKARLTGDARWTVQRSAANLLECSEINHFDVPPRPLMPFSDNRRANDSGNAALPMQAFEYVRLVEASGLLRVHGKRGRIDPALDPVLTRLGFSSDEWLGASTAFGQLYRRGELQLTQVA